MDRERIRDRFRVVPAALLVSGAVLTVEARQIGVPVSWRSGFSVAPGEAAAGTGDGAADGPPDRAVLAGLSLGEGRSLYQDPAFGIRQLADIASQALSPAVNQPTTAVQVIDRLEEILLHLGRRPDRSPYCADQAGTVRLVEPVRDWDSYLDLAFSEITRYGSSSPQVARRLLASYQALQRGLGPGRRAAVRSRQAALREESAGCGFSPAILRPDSMGLG